MATNAAAQRILIKLTSDALRVSWCNLVTLVATAIILIGPITNVAKNFNRETLADDLLVSLFLVWWLLSCALYLVTTHIVFTRVPEKQLHERVRVEPRKPTFWSRVFGVDSAVSFSTQAAVLAVIVTVLISRRPEQSGDLSTVILTLTSVAGSWALMAQSFALHYYRGWIREKDPELPGIDSPTYEDFWHYSLMVASQLGATAAFQTRASRKTLHAQAILALFFNTVVIAMVVSFMMS